MSVYMVVSRLVQVCPRLHRWQGLGEGVEELLLQEAGGPGQPADGEGQGLGACGGCWAVGVRRSKLRDERAVGPLGIGWRKLGGVTLGAGPGCRLTLGAGLGLARGGSGPSVCSWCLPGCSLGVARPGCSPAEGLPPSPGEGCGEGPHPCNQALLALGPLLPWGPVPTVTSSGPLPGATSQPPPHRSASTCVPPGGLKDDVATTLRGADQQGPLSGCRWEWACCEGA